MKTILTQKKFLGGEKTFEIMERGVQVTTSNFNNTTPTFIKFESTGYRIASINKAENGFLVAFFSAPFVGPLLYFVSLSPNSFGRSNPIPFWFAMFIAIAASIIALILFFKSIKKRTYLIDNANINSSFSTAISSLKAGLKSSG